VLSISALEPTLRSNVVVFVCHEAKQLSVYGKECNGQNEYNMGYIKCNVQFQLTQSPTKRELSNNDIPTARRFLEGPNPLQQNSLYRQPTQKRQSQRHT
jgi:hypothetical protein